MGTRRSKMSAEQIARVQDRTRERLNDLTKRDERAALSRVVKEATAITQSAGAEQQGR